MICKNNTGFPEEALNRILRFVDPDRVICDQDGEIVITHDNDNDRAGIFLPWKGPDYGFGGTGKIIIFFRHDDTEDNLVLTLAHELRHMWQWYHEWDLFHDDELSEIDARVYARLMYDLWKKGGWTWKTLKKTKRLYVPVDPEITAMVISKK
jgi:hypothetical protein